MQFRRGSSSNDLSASMVSAALVNRGPSTFINNNYRESRLDVSASMICESEGNKININEGHCRPTLLA